MKILISISLLLVLISCTGEKKLHRLLKKYPHLTQTEIVTFQDTIRDTIRVEVPGVSTNQNFSLDQLKDTVYIDTNQLSIIIYSKGDSVFVEGACDTVFVQVPFEKIITRKIPVDKIIYRKPRDWLRILVWSFLIGFSTHYFISKYRSKKETAKP